MSRKVRAISENRVLIIMCLILISDLCLPKAELSTKNSTNSALLSFGRVFGIQFDSLEKNLITLSELYLYTHSLYYLFQIFPTSIDQKYRISPPQKNLWPIIQGFLGFFPNSGKKNIVWFFFLVGKLYPPVIHSSKISRF